MKRVLLNILLVCLPVVGASAYDVVIDGIYYNLNTEDNSAEVTYAFTIYPHDYDCLDYYTDDVTIPSYIIINNIRYNVTGIGKFAFTNCCNVTYITIPESVTTIGEEAFCLCKSLESITIPESVTSIGEMAFKDCTGLISVTIGNGVTAIGNEAFDGCISLTSITIPEGVTSIGWGTFQGCIHLTSITIPESVTNIGDSAFSHCSSLTSITIPESVTIIGNSAFYGCSNLTSITIPDRVTTIGELAFAYCYNEWHSTGLTSVTIGRGVKTIGDNAFSGCWKLNSVHITDLVAWCNIEFSGNNTPFVYASHLYLNGKEVKALTIPDVVTYIGQYTFYGCSSLTSVMIPNSVTKIEPYAFWRCGAMKSLTIGNGLKYIGRDAFSECSSLASVHITDLSAWCNIDFQFQSNPLAYAKHLFLNGEEIKDMVIPDVVTSIASYAFDNCYGLTSVTLPPSVTQIGEYAFAGCSNIASVHIQDLSAWCKINFQNEYSNPLRFAHHVFMKGKEIKNLKLPDDVISIGKRAFEYCTELTSITIGENVESIDSYAFQYCSGLTDVYCHAENVPSTNIDAFMESSIGEATLYVPDIAIDLYQATESWSGFGSIKPLAGEIQETPKCATPSISYNEGQITFSCDTDDVDFISEITDTDIKKHYDAEIQLSATYHISVYATKTGYDNSDVAEAILCWIDGSFETEGTTIDVIKANATPALIKSRDGLLSVEGLPDGTRVSIYTTAGTQVCTSVSSNGIAIVDTELPSGTIAIIKAGENSVKITIK